MHIMAFGVHVCEKCHVALLLYLLTHKRENRNNLDYSINAEQYYIYAMYVHVC